MPREKGRKVVASNRKARHDYTIIETFEAGIELRGTEVKSLRDSKAQLTDAYATVESGQLYLRNAHISIYDPGSYSNHEPTRTRRLLMHKAEIRKLFGFASVKGNALIPLAFYWKKGKVKVLLGVGKGKVQFDKREDIKKRDSDRELKRVTMHRLKGK